MKLIICLLYWENKEQTTQFRGWLSRYYPDLVAKQLKGKVTHVISGRHCQSANGHIHWHINIILKFEEGKYKKYKDLGSKIHRLKIDIPKEYKEIFPKKYQVKFYYEDNPDYNEQCMGYPLKEYAHITDVPLMLQQGYGDEEIEELRKRAHSIWLPKFQEHQQKKEEEIKLKDYLDDHVNVDEDSPPGYKIRQVIRKILFYRKLQHKQGTTKSVQLTRLKDQAVSYLYFKNLITESDIIEELRI